MSLFRSLRSGTYILAALLTLAVAGAMIGATWYATNRLVAGQDRETIQRAEATVAGLGATYAEQINRHILALDQSLEGMVRDWETDPRRFNLEAARARATVLAGISREMFLADENGTVRQSSVPEAVGQSVAALEVFRDAAERAPPQANDKPKLYIGPPTISPIMRQWHLDVSRTLRNPDGSFAGLIVADYRVSAITDVFEASPPGPNGFAALFNVEDGRLRATLGAGNVAPDANISDTPLFAVVDAGAAGLWVGPSPTDATTRIHAFRRLPNRDLAIAVGLDRQEVFRSANTWALQARLSALGISGLISIVAILLLGSLYATRRLAARTRENNARLAAANALAEVARAHAEASARQLQATFATVADGVALFDAHLNLVEWNTLFPERAGINPGFVRTGMPMEDVLRLQAQGGYFGAVVDKAAEVERRAALFRAGHFGDCQRFHVDGREIELRCRPLAEGGFVALYTDVTEARMAREALGQAGVALDHERSARTRFLGAIGHELRAGVATLFQALGWLRAAELTPEQTRAVDRAQRAGVALSGLADAAEDVPRMERGGPKLEPEMLAVRPLLRDIVDTFQPAAGDRGLTVYLVVDETTPEELVVDPARIRQILTLMLSEAARLAAPEAMWVLAGAEEAGGTDNPVALRLTIRGFGDPIPEAARARIFPGFDAVAAPARADAGSERTEREGTGLGMAIARHLAALMGGALRCDSWSAADGRTGNDFVLFLPHELLPGQAAGHPAGEGEARAPGRATAEARPLPRTRILLIGAPSGLQLATATLLRREGHMVDSVANGAGAVRALNRAPYDVAFMDSVLSDMTVETAARYVRHLPGPGRTVPIAVLAPAHAPEEAEAWRDAGVDDILSSPPNLHDLLDSIGRHVWLGNAPPPPPPAEAWREEREEGIPLLSVARITELRANIPRDQLAEMAEECINDLFHRLPALRRALAVGAPGAISAQAHAMAGMAGGYGMAVLEARLRAILAAVREGRLHTIEGAAAVVETDLTRTAAALRQAVRQGEPAQ